MACKSWWSFPKYEVRKINDRLTAKGEERKKGEKKMLFFMFFRSNIDKYIHIINLVWWLVVLRSANNDFVDFNRNSALYLVAYGDYIPIIDCFLNRGCDATWPRSDRSFLLFSFSYEWGKILSPIPLFANSNSANWRIRIWEIIVFLANFICYFANYTELRCNSTTVQCLISLLIKLNSISCTYV